jgi:hypothetical protein
MSQNGWSGTAGPVRDMPQADIERREAGRGFAIPNQSEEVLPELKVIRTEKLGEHDAILLFTTNSSGPPPGIVFRSAGGLLLRQLRFGSSPLGLNPTQIDYVTTKYSMASSSSAPGYHSA